MGTHLVVRSAIAIICASSTLMLASALRLPSDCPNCAPVPVAGSLPWFTADGSAFHVNGSAATLRYKNRPLYGPHNSGLALAGDRPIVHVADDTHLYGGLLLGLIRGDVAQWAHDADSVTVSFAGAAGISWLIKDAKLPGLELSASVMHVSDGIGLVLDVNVTDDGSVAGPSAELVWAFGCGTTPSGGQRLGWQYDALVNSGTLKWSFSPSDCTGNRVTLDPSNRSFTFAFGSSTVGVALAAPGGASLTIADASGWANVTSLLAEVGTQSAERPSVPVTRRATALPLPISGATLWLRASSLAATHADGSPVAAWADESGSGAVLIQADTKRQPVFDAAGMGASGAPGVRFDGLTTMLASPIPGIGAQSTTLAVIRDAGSSGGDNCCSGVIFWNASFTGIATRPGATAGTTTTVLDWAGSDGYGVSNIRDRAVVAASVYHSGGPSMSYVDGCVEFTAPSVSGVPSVGGVMIGARNDELRRYFYGAIGEIVVFPRPLNVSELALMQAYFASTWPVTPAPHCNVTSTPLAVGRAKATQGPGTTRFTLASVANARGGGAAVDPLAQLTSAKARAQRLTSAVAVAPDPLVGAAVAALQGAVDGLFRDDPGAFVHGAMAWDTLYAGWRSEYGGTVWGWSELVTLEGAYFIRQQIKDSPHTVCASDPALLLTQEGATSRFHGTGRIDVGGNIYDMQTQFFDQQIHVWRWTGNTTHEALLRPALKLHAQWAADCFDADRNGLYSSYGNTWPTDSQWYNGGETWEEVRKFLFVQANVHFQ